VQGEGDTVTATALPDRPGHVEIESIEGDGGRLTLEAPKNCVGIAAIETLKLIGQTSCGVSLRLQKVCSKLHLLITQCSTFG
jgi:homoserine kinase